MSTCIRENYVTQKKRLSNANLWRIGTTGDFSEPVWGSFGGGPNYPHFQLSPLIKDTFFNYQNLIIFFYFLFIFNIYLDFLGEN